MTGNGSIIVENRGKGPLTLEVEFTNDKNQVVTRAFEWGDPYDRSRPENPSPTLALSKADWDLLNEHQGGFLDALVDKGELTVAKRA